MKIDPSHLVPANYFTGTYPIEIDLAYANPDHPDNHFKCLYSSESKILWTHKELAKLVLVASIITHKLWGWKLRLYDSLRPVEAQKKMQEFGYDGLLVSAPGKGAHPRALAIDLAPIDQNGLLVNMGTRFDHFSSNPKEYNPAARNFTEFSGELGGNYTIWHNRSKLDFAIQTAANLTDFDLLPLPQEWWDFRAKPEFFEKFAPLSENDLLPCQRLISPDVSKMQEILMGIFPARIQESINEVASSCEKFTQKINLEYDYYTKSNS
ncbi:MAG: hypothetical protein SFT93_00235 [Rickettsiaceae bacterium]|nr:hypothetical protein [Rickettsiaceae bacterium]